MTDIPNPTSRDEARELLERHIPFNEWTNFGDANPAPHGGMWCNYDASAGDGTFEAVTTFQSAQVGLDADPEDYGDQYVWEVTLGWSELVTRHGELAKNVAAVIASLSGHEPDIQHIVANGVDFRYYVVDMAREIGLSRRIETTDYDDVLRLCGVEPDEW